MNTPCQNLHQSLNAVKNSTPVKSINHIVTRIISSDYFNQFISIILK